MYYELIYIYFFTKIGSSHNYKVPIKCVALAADLVYSKAQHNIAYIHYNGHYYYKRF